MKNQLKLLIYIVLFGIVPLSSHAKSDFRHTDSYYKDEAFTYANISYNHVQNLSMSDIRALGIPSSEATVQEAYAGLKKFSIDSSDAKRNQFGLHFGIGYKTNYWLRYEGVFEYLQGSRYLYTPSAPLTLKKTSIQGYGNQFAVDIFTRFASLGGNLYVDIPVYKSFRVFPVFGMGVEAVTGSMRFITGRIEITRTKESYNNFAVSAQYGAGFAVNLVPRVDFQVTFMQKERMFGFGQTSTIDGKKIPRPPKYSITMFTVGLLFKNRP
jgi:hypothetical protein